MYSFTRWGTETHKHRGKYGNLQSGRRKITAETARNISTCFSGNPKYLWVMLLNSEMNNKEKNELISTKKGHEIIPVEQIELECKCKREKRKGKIRRKWKYCGASLSLSPSVTQNVWITTQLIIHINALLANFSPHASRRIKRLSSKEKNNNTNLNQANLQTPMFKKRAEKQKRKGGL